MEYTNRLSLPQYIVDWLIHDNYDFNFDPYTISATSLMKPTKANLLTLRHKDFLVEDVSDLVASRLGHAVHDSVERIQTPMITKEVRTERLFPLESVTYKVTGKYDVLEEHSDNTFSIRDMKTTSVWAYIFGGKDNDYRTQLSIYKWLLSPTKTIRDTAFIDFFFTDWQSSKARYDKNYPQQRLFTGYKIQLLSLEETENYIRERLIALEADRNKADEQLTPCTKEELWAENEVYAVYKNGNQKATKLCDSKAEAEAYLIEKQIAGYIQQRPPKVKRCGYCSAFPFCLQGQSYLKQGLLV